MHIKCFKKNLKEYTGVTSPDGTASDSFKFLSLSLLSFTLYKSSFQIISFPGDN